MTWKLRLVSLFFCVKSYQMNMDAGVDVYPKTSQANKVIPNVCFFRGCFFSHMQVSELMSEAWGCRGFMFAHQLLLPEGIRRENNKMCEEVEIPPNDPMPVGFEEKPVYISELDEVGAIIIDTPWTDSLNLWSCSIVGENIKTHKPICKQKTFMFKILIQTFVILCWTFFLIMLTEAKDCRCCLLLVWQCLEPCLALTNLQICISFPALVWSQWCLNSLTVISFLVWKLNGDWQLCSVGGFGGF